VPMANQVDTVGGGTWKKPPNIQQAVRIYDSLLTFA
jgi:hypothetical protein